MMRAARMPGISRRHVIKAGAAIGGALFIPNVGRAQNEPRRGGTLRVAMPYNPASVDPITGRNQPDFNVLYAVFDPLIDFDAATLELKPGLAKAWRFTDPRTLVLDLVEGVRFHDGSAFDAEAVKLNLERCKSDPRSTVKGDVRTIDRIDVTGHHSVALKLTRTNAGLPTILTSRAGCMISPASAQGGRNVDRTPVGTGPFKFVEWQDNANFKLVRNATYRTPGLPYLDAIEMRIISDLNTVVRSVIAGESDLALTLEVPQKLLVDRVPTVIADANPSMNFYGVFLNYGKPPLDDVRVRQGLNYATDRDQLNTVIMNGLAETTSAILPRAHWACDPATADYYKCDVEKAKKLLSEAGYPNGLDIEAFGWPDQVASRRQELLMAQWSKAGIRIKLTTAAPQHAMEFFMLQSKGSMLISPTGGFPDPTQFYEAMFGADALRNASKIELPGFRPLLDRTMDALDQSARKAAFADLQRFVIEQALQVPQYINRIVTVRTKKVNNFSNGLLATPKFHEVWLEA
jgi:ABC-type transport system substrate-binding protein